MNGENLYKKESSDMDRVEEGIGCVICTIITKNRLSYARALAQSIRTFHPSIKIYILLADRADGYLNPEAEPFILINLEDFPDQETIKRMTFYYSSFELCCALRGMFYEYIFTRTSASSLIFLDSDILICNPLSSIFLKLNKTSILLSPHTTIPMNVKYALPHELNILRFGLYNAGFLGLNRTDEALAFISWFKNRLEMCGFNDISSGQTGDQLWLNFVPIYFQKVSFLLDAGANIGHWNLHEKILKKDEFGNITVNGQDLLFVHFSGWDISFSKEVSKYAPIYNNNSPSLWKELADVYRQKLLDNHYKTTIFYPYAFDYFTNGRPILQQMRKIYFNDLEDGKIYNSSPFACYSYFNSRLRPKGIKYFLRHIKTPAVDILRRLLE